MAGLMRPRTWKMPSCSNPVICEETKSVIDINYINAVQWDLSGNSNNSLPLPFQHTRRWTLGRAAVVGWCREHTNMKTLFMFVIHIHIIIGDFVDLYQVSRNMSVANFDGNVTLETLALSKQAGWIAVTISQLLFRPPGVCSPLQHQATLGWQLQLLQL